MTEVSIKYGEFMTNLIDFVIVAFAVFMVIKALNKLKKAEAPAQPAPPPGPTDTEKLLTEIRDSLKKVN